MATIIINNKQFKIIKLNFDEAIKLCKFGIIFDGEELLICDNCNDLIVEEKELYYVACMNRLFCKKCYEEWYINATRYKEDIPYEEKYFNTYAKLLNLI